MRKKKRRVPSQCLKFRIGQDGLLFYRIGRPSKGQDKRRGGIQSPAQSSVFSRFQIPYDAAPLEGKEMWSIVERL